MKLADQVAIVTGAGRNIGEETAKLFAAEGAAVAVVDMDRGRADRVAGAIVAAGGKAKAYLCDVSQEGQIVDTVKTVSADWGRLDILINNVAISDNKHLFDITKEEWDRVFAVCLTAPMLFSKYAANPRSNQLDNGRRPQARLRRSKSWTLGTTRLVAVASRSASASSDPV